MADNDFYSVLSAAIDDMLKHGFDDIERVNAWTRKIRDAAEHSLIRPESLEQRLRDALADRYRKLVDSGEIARYHEGIDRFTIERIKPSLRAELDRRIAASANLIKLNRAESIDKTLRRFQGWSTSLPPGGVSGESRAEVRTTVRASMKSLPFEERRVIIDQSHKLFGAINEIVASDGGAIAGRWRSHWRQPGYNYRPEHKERDEEVYLIRDSWAHRAGLVKKGGNPYYDEITAVGQEPFCRCYMIWIYSLRELPAENLTAKGKEALAQARGQEEVRAARMGRADDAGPRPDAAEKPARGVWHLSWGRPNALGGWTQGTWCNRMQGDLGMGMNCTDNPAEVTCTFCKNKIAARGLPRANVREDEAVRLDAIEGERAPAVGYEAIRRRLERLSQGHLATRGNFP